MKNDKVIEEARLALKQLRSIGLCEGEVCDFIEVAIEKIDSESFDDISYFKVPHHVYVNELGNKVMTMNDEQLGNFVRKTLWTVTGKR